MQIWAPTLVAARTALPPEGELRLRPGKAGSTAPVGEEGCPKLVAARIALPPKGALRLRPGKARSVTPVGEEMRPHLKNGQPFCAWL